MTVGTHQGGIQHPHLDYYLDEFTFRFNRRRSQARGLLFDRWRQSTAARSRAGVKGIPIFSYNGYNRGDLQLFKLTLISGGIRLSIQPKYRS